MNQISGTRIIGTSVPTPVWERRMDTPVHLQNNGFIIKI